MAEVTAEFSSDECAELALKYPLLVRASAGVVEGVLDMYALYKEVEVCRDFTLRIMAQESGYPAVFETGGMIDQLAVRHRIRDCGRLHRNHDGSLCVGTPLDLQASLGKRPRLLMFIEAAVVPYLFAVARVEAGEEWPWGERSHGIMGLLESCAEVQSELLALELDFIASEVRKASNWKAVSKQVRHPSAQARCPCGRDRPFEVCHALAWRGVLRLSRLAHASVNPVDHVLRRQS